MYTQLEDSSKAVLEAVKQNPGCTAQELWDKLPDRYTMKQVNNSLHVLWKGRYVVRQKAAAPASDGRTPFVFTFKTEKARRKKWGTRGAVSLKDEFPTFIHSSYPRTPETEPQTRPEVKPEVKAPRPIEIMLAVTSTPIQTLILTPTELRSLYATLKDLLGVKE